MNQILKKFTALVLALTVILSSSSFVNASTVTGQQKLDKLVELNVITGDSNGVVGTDTMTRYRSVVMMLRLEGLEAEMNAYNYVGKTTFTDAAGKSTYVQRLMSYLKNHPELGVAGYPDGSFKPLAPITAKEHAKVMLEVLGYTYNSDFTWATVSAKALEIGLVSSVAAIDADTNFTVSDLANFTYDALTLNAKGETAMNLGEELGFVIAITQTAIKSVTVTNANEITAVFNNAVDTTKAVLKVKKGAAVYGSTVVWNTEKTTATLTTVVNLPAADYSLEVTGLTATALTNTFTVNEVVATKVEVVPSTVALVDSSTIAFKVSNQYGSDMKINGTTAGVVVSAYNTTQKRIETLTNLTADNKLTLAANFASAVAPAKLGDVIRVTVTYAGLTIQSNVTVVDVSASAAIAFADIAPLATKTRISISETGLVIPYTMMDQFGADKKLSTHVAAADGIADVETISGVLFVSSNPAVVDVDTFAVDADGKLTFATGATAGTATITAVINSSGAVASFKVTTNSVGVVDSLVISAPSALIAATESVKLNLSAADQFGTAIAAKDIAGVAMTSSDTNVIANGSTITEGKLNVTTLAAGTAVLTAKVGTKIVGTVTVVVEAAAVATEIKSVSVGPKMEVGATKLMTTDNFVVIDQYGRTMDKTLFAGFSVAAKAPVGALVTVAGVTFTATAAGSQEFTLTASAGVTKDFTLTAIASSDITSYAITAVPTIYSDNTDTLHAKDLELVGKTSSGDTVILKSGKITHATTSNGSVVKVTNNAGVVTVEGFAAANEGTSLVAVWDGATKLAETTVTVTKAAPVITSIKFKDTVETFVTVAAGANHTAVITNDIEILDQYGVAIAGGGVYTTSDSAKATNPAGTVTGVAVGDVTVGYVTSNGLVATTVITVQ